MSSNLYWRLSIMMFFNFLVWGAWNITLGSYLFHLGFAGTEIGGVFSVFYLAALISPFIGGQITDRYVPAQIFMGICHFFGGFLLIWLAGIQEYNSMWWIMFIYSLLFVPSLALTNAICFHHLSNTEKEFGGIRVWGTIGWIVAGLFLTFWWTFVSPFEINWNEIQALSESEQATRLSDFLANESFIFTFAGWASIIYGLYCFTLPNTPPAKEASNPFAFLEALKLLKDKNFAFFMILCFVFATELMFFYLPTPGFLQSSLIGIDTKNVPAVITIFAQGAEVITLFLILPYVLPNWGLKKSLALGVVAWPIRYALFSLAQPWWLVVLALTLHGFCYVFFFVVGQIYVDTVAPKDIRNSAQSLLTMVTFGLGLYTGSLFTGWVQELFTDNSVVPAVVNYQALFLVPTVLTVICAIAFFFFFKDPRAEGERTGDPVLDHQT